jgi:diadenosine tetraphosphate (Ap4A) HIT family hydrolase
MNSPFLKIPQSEYIAENELAFAVISLHGVSPGHSLIIPKRLAKDWSELNSSEKQAIIELTDQVIEIVEKEYSPDGINVGFNQGAAAGQTVFHMHMHVIPRFEGDVEDPRGGVRFVIPDKANYLK